MVGVTEFLMGHPDQAAAESKKALELDPDLWNGPILLSEIYVMQGRPQDALPEIERMQGDDIRLHLRALAYYALGQKKEADAALNKFIANYHTRSAYYIATVYAFGTSPMKHSTGWIELMPNETTV